jgi:3-methyladenine DNA glycosylase/8-oxoguanine DNA glycosylase
MGWTAELDLRGPGGEPVDLRRCVRSHGLTALPPLARHDDALGFDAVVALPGEAPVRVAVRGVGHERAVVSGPAGDPAAAVAAVAWLLRLDEDLSPFYALVADDPDLSWAARGAGRLMRSQTVFEDVVKTICTTNCAWSGTVRMVGALVGGLGTEARGGGRAFPTPEQMAAAPEAWYADVARAGYRGPFLRGLAADVASGALDLDALAALEDDDELEARLLELAGVGPYAAAHVMLMLGRHSRLVLDSWTRPTYHRVAGARKLQDATIRRRFRRYGPYAGLAFWLRITEDWLAQDSSGA